MLCHTLAEFQKLLNLDIITAIKNIIDEEQSKTKNNINNKRYVSSKLLNRTIANVSKTILSRYCLF